MRLSLQTSVNISNASRCRIAPKTGLRLVTKVFDPGKIDSPAKVDIALKESDRILKEREAAGVVIGSISGKIWNHEIQLNELTDDLDVLVLDKYFELKQPFEGGIDWWLKDSYGATDYWTNANNILLSFEIGESTHLKPGLYIPEMDFVVDMCFKGVLGLIEPEVDNFDELYDVIKGYLNKNFLKGKVADWVADEFYVLDRKYYLNPPLWVKDISYEVLSLIKQDRQELRTLGVKHSALIERLSKNK